MLKMLSKTLFIEDDAMMNAEDTRNSFGWRVMTERKQARLSQQAVCDRLEREFGIKITYGALSQIETGETKRFHIDMLFALAKIFAVNPYTLLTGEEIETPVAWSAEAEEVARLVDQMQPPTRQAIVDAAKSALEAERQLLQRAEKQMLESERELARIMKSYISHLSDLANGDRKVVDDYIDRIDRNDRNRNGSQSA